ncbi:hypothetical protein CVD28_00355 [Bacillus sp. M6-12]|uniref:hypothetical protein n=1 Tax=Bacillus sp. M6-12 TaxID=2054166 RepID=UPI000C77EE2D|nr:hypothetical protein [Bacillus sp. M6-12]PLS18887.1 hypothetical protein CVD28_00355 [Bacillus sp. M6-12]
MENRELQDSAIDICEFIQNKKIGTLPMKSEKYEKYAIDIVTLTKLGWTFEITDNGFAYSYATHKEAETVFFSTDEELAEWIALQFQFDEHIK